MGIGAAVAAVGVAGTIGSAVMSDNAANKAAKAQLGASNSAIGLQEQQLQQEQANSAPYLQVGSGALAQLAGLYGINTSPVSNDNASGASATGFNANTGGASGTYTNAAGGSSTANPNASFYLSPDYNFTLTQGLKGLTAQGAATNGTDNGATQKAEIQYAGNLAAGQYQNYKAGLLSLAGLGSGTAANTNAVTAGTASNASGLTYQQGSDLASSYLAQGQINSNALNTGSGIASNYLPYVVDAMRSSAPGVGNSMGNNGTDSAIVAHQGGSGF